MTKHKPVLLQQAIASLNIKPGGIYVDATLGGGGHAELLLEKLAGKGKLLAFDLDFKAIARFEKHLLEQGFRKNGSKLTKKSLEVILINSNFSELESELINNKVTKVDGILADLGLSTDQIESVPGISFLKNSELDMRIDEKLNVKAADLLNGLYKKELIGLFREYGDVDFAEPLVRAIIQQRKHQPFTKTEQLTRLIQEIVPFSKRRGTSKHPEAKVFQALRIAVNDELNSLRRFLPQALGALSPGGYLAVISFHSGEDRIVKNFAKEKLAKREVEVFDLIKPSDEELRSNPRSSSAKLRVLKKIELIPNSEL